MTKDEWEKERKKDIHSIEVYFKYYREKGGKLDDISQFSSIFHQMNGQIISCESGIKQLSQESALKRLRDYYDQKFEMNEDT